VGNVVCPLLGITLVKASSLNSAPSQLFWLFDIPKVPPSLVPDPCASHLFLSRFSLELCTPLLLAYVEGKDQKVVQMIGESYGTHD
jgi:hypothetical protein